MAHHAPMLVFDAMIDLLNYDVFSTQSLEFVVIATEGLTWAPLFGALADVVRGLGAFAGGR